jgi:hypothetical protein
MNPVILPHARIAFGFGRHSAGRTLFFRSARRFCPSPFLTVVNTIFYHVSYSNANRMFYISRFLSFPLFAPFAQGKRPETRAVTGNFAGFLNFSIIVFFY